MIAPVSKILNPSKYQGKLLDLRWEQKRSQIMRSRERVCGSCRRSDIPLQVHHIYYEMGREPWDYPDDAYHILCAGCHQDWHALNQAFRVHVSGRMPVKDFRVLVAALKVGIEQHGSDRIALSIAQLVCEPETMRWLKLRMEQDIEK